MEMYNELQQTAVARGRGNAPTEATPLAASPRPRLHYQLSIEHAAMIQQLDSGEMRILEQLGAGRDSRRTAQRLSIAPRTFQGQVAKIRKKTGMSRLQLSAVGYLMRCQAA
ncbi:MAG: hypothetical protein ABSF62_02515 [Bryobacteraceae bacterium]|jgi:DNA-binding CsgD family transcriptional regulator